MRTKVGTLSSLRKVGMIITRKAGLTLLAVTIGIGSAAQVEPTLDLTAPQVKTREQSRTTACGYVPAAVVTSHGRARGPGLPLEVEFELLGNTLYRVGDDITSTVRITNVGAKPISIPWSPDPDIVFGRDCEWLPKPQGVSGLRGTVRLEFVDEDRHVEFIGSHVLYGILSNPETYRELAPRQSAIIRISGTIDFWNIVQKTREERLQLKLPQDFIVGASFDLDEGPQGTSYARVLSRNHLRVKVSKK